MADIITATIEGGKLVIEPIPIVEDRLSKSGKTNLLVSAGMPGADVKIVGGVHDGKVAKISMNCFTPIGGGDS